MNRRIVLLLVSGVVLLVLLFAMSPGFAQPTKADGKAGGAKKTECIPEIDAKAGGVVAKAPCEPEPPKA